MMIHGVAQVPLVAPNSTFLEVQASPTTTAQGTSLSVAAAPSEAAKGVGAAMMAAIGDFFLSINMVF